MLTGGAANLDGMPEIAEQIFDLPVRRGVPTGVGGLADHIENPSFATAVGLLLRAGQQRVQAKEQAGSSSIGRIADRFRSVLREFFS